MNPGAFLHGIARHLSLRISIHERTPVIRLEGSGPWTLAAPGGTVRARSVVLATNAYTARLLPQLPIAPTRGQVLATEPISRVVVPFPMYANHGYQYWRQTQDGRLVIGGWRNLDVAGERGWEERLHPHIQSSLENFLRTVAGGDVPVTHRWAGIMGFTPDHMPLVGALSRRDALFIAAGFSGHGVSMAFTCGGLAARLGLGGPADVPAAFDPARFGTE
jgi:glycine/D-amino acid oxidase-like deaminating enzyme